MVNQELRGITRRGKGVSSQSNIVEIPNPYSLFITTSVANNYTLYLTGSIEAPERYEDIFYTLRTMQEQDTMTIILNNHGGYLSTAIQFVVLMKECKGTITTVIEGHCESASTMIFLSGHNREVKPNARFLVHNYSGGSWGKGGECWKSAQFDREWTINFMRSVYEGFLTEQELNRLFDDDDVILNTDQVKERLAKMDEASVQNMIDSMEEDGNMVVLGEGDDMFVIDTETYNQVVAHYNNSQAKTAKPTKTKRTNKKKEPSNELLD